MRVANGIVDNDCQLFHLGFHPITHHPGSVVLILQLVHIYYTLRAYDAVNSGPTVSAPPLDIPRYRERATQFRLSLLHKRKCSGIHSKAIVRLNKSLWTPSYTIQNTNNKRAIQRHLLYCECIQKRCYGWIW